MEKILVTGASGFVGHALCRGLQEKNYDVQSISHKDGDICDSSLWESLQETGINRVIHLAAKTFVPDAWETPLPFYQTNCGGTGHALEFCRKIGAAFTYISSYIYGTPETLPISEKTVPLPNNPYMHSKYMAEELVRFYGEQYDMHVTVLRPFNLYGPGQEQRFLIPTIIQQFLYSDKIQVQTLLPKRDYLYISDFVSAIIASFADKNNEVYNVASGISYSVAEIIQTSQTWFGTERPVYAQNKVLRKNDVPDVVADIQKIRTKLGWQPSITLNQGIGMTIEYERTRNE